MKLKNSKIFSKKFWFIVLMTISTLTLAGTAAYYSVFGLSTLFAGAKFQVIIMASALEFAKLILASYLHNNWKSAGWMKWYLTIALVTLMGITSAGIYGFLTSAYQKTADQLNVIDKKVDVIELKRDRFVESLDGYKLEKHQLNNSISELTIGLSNNTIQYKDKETGQIITTTSSSTRRVLTQQLNDMKSQRDGVSQKMESLTDSITKMDLQILDLESNNDIAAEVGPLRYISEITNKPMGIIVNWFTLLIVFVFDPLAISMVIALNKLINRKEDGSSIGSGDISDNDSGSGDNTQTNDESIEEVRILSEEVEKEGTEGKEEVVEATKEVVEETKKEKQIKKVTSPQPVRKRYSDSVAINEGRG